MEITGEPTVSRGVREQSFSVPGPEPIPGVLWQPDSGVANALVMLGHGGTADKRADYLLAVARWLVRDHGIAGVRHRWTGTRRTSSRIGCVFAR